MFSFWQSLVNLLRIVFVVNLFPLSVNTYSPKGFNSFNLSANHVKSAGIIAERTPASVLGNSLIIYS